MNYKERTNRLIRRTIALADLGFILFMLVVLGSYIWFPDIYQHMNRSFELKHLVSLLGYLWVRSQAKSIFGDLRPDPSPDRQDAQTRE